MTRNANKGEWSEFYAFLYLLGEGKIYAADENVRKIKNIFFPIMKILRNEASKGRCEYKVGDKTIDIIVNGERIKTVSREELKENACRMFQEILNGKNSSFSIPFAYQLMDEMNCESIAAPSTNKTDITMQIHDINTGYEPIVGFSIKSEVGSSPTLLNASKLTNFIFKVTGLSDEQMEIINSMETKNKIEDRISYINKYGNFEFVKVNGPIFGINLMMIDSRMEEMIAHMLLYHYVLGLTTCKDILDQMERSNPLKFPRENFYKFKFKKFLCAVALGMVPRTEWSGIEEANGGYIIVNADGEVLAYYIYNRNFFEEYLLENTKFERGSTTRHDYARLYKDEDTNEMYMNLNLQIRFK